MNKNSDKFLEKLNSLINCNPENCLKENCPLYYEEVNKCDAYRFISTFNSTMKEKLEKVEKYDPFSE